MYQNLNMCQMNLFLFFSLFVSKQACFVLVWCMPPLCLVEMAMVAHVWLNWAIRIKPHNPTRAEEWITNHLRDYVPYLEKCQAMYNFFV